jgi:hypothetical protein
MVSCRRSAPRGLAVPCIVRSLVALTVAACTARTASPGLGTVASTTSPAQSGSADALAAGLTSGLRLVYASGGSEQPAWTVDSVTHGVVVGARQGCARIVLRTRPNQPTPELRLLCRGGDTLFAWNAAAAELRVQRPIGAGMSVAIPQANGGSVRYVTGDAGRAEVSGRGIGFVHTTVTTHDASGRLVRRLRERYAVSLATALDGVFEVPDSAAVGGWRETQRFTLARVE